MENSVSEASLYLQDQVSGPWSRPQGPRPPPPPQSQAESSPHLVETSVELLFYCCGLNATTKNSLGKGRVRHDEEGLGTAN